MDSAAYSGGVPDLRAQLARLERELRGTHRRFLVTRMGSSGSTWLAKLLNSHPEVFELPEPLHEVLLQRGLVG
jgi:hypothetical protein